MCFELALICQDLAGVNCQQFFNMVGFFKKIDTFLNLGLDISPTVFMIKTHCVACCNV